MKRARVAFAGAIHDATPHRDGVQLADGRVLAEDATSSGCRRSSRSEQSSRSA